MVIAIADSKLITSFKAAGILLELLPVCNE